MVGMTAASLGTEDANGVVDNLSSETQVAQADQVPGACEGVQKAGGPEGNFEGIQESSTGVLPHLQDLLQRSSVCLTKDQANEVEEVLVQ